jgi:hypothetical protein
MSIANWIAENKAAYFGNATSRRDYRAQLRGTRVIWIWGLYLGVLVLMAGMTYGNAVRRGEQMPISEIQFELQQFYHITTYSLAALILLIAPALTATTIVSERVMKSLDLVLTSPMSFKHYLVGKMISGYRYIWMLLILALPVTAVSVVMGGATWIDVLGAYIILSSAGLVITAIGLLISSLTQGYVAAVIWTYLTVGAYILAISSVGAGMLFGGRSQSGQEAPWFFATHPFFAGHAAPTHTVIGGYDVPNYLIALAYSVLITKILLLGAGSALSGYGAAEVKSLRIQTPIFVFLLGILVASSAASGGEQQLIEAAGAISVAALIFMPHIACASPSADRKYRPEGGIFSLADMIKGGPAGALPFLWLLAAALFTGIYTGTQLTSVTTLGPTYWTAMLWVMAFWTFWWSLGRLVSNGRTDLRSNRMIMLLLMLLVMGMPIPFLGGDPIYNESALRSAYILFPLGRGNMASTGMPHIIVLFTVSALIAFAAEIARKRERMVVA